MPDKISDRNSSHDARQFRALIEDSPLGIQILSEDSERLYCNQAFVDLIGAESREAVLRQSQIADFVASYDRERVDRIRRDRISGADVPVSYEYDLVHSDGHIVNVEVFTRPIVWQGQPAHQRTYVDLTARKHAETAARKSEQVYRDIIEASPDGMLVIREGGTILYANSAAGRMFGGDGTPCLAGRDIMDLVHPDHRAEILAVRRRDRDASGLRSAEVVRLRLDGTSFPSQSRSVVVTWRGEPALLLVIQDLTEKQMMERQLRQAQKMEAIGQLTGGIAHDFNNLLTVIQGNAELLDADLDGLGGRKLTSIRVAARRGAELTHRLLAFARQQPLKPSAVHLGGVIAGMREMLARMLGETIDIEIVRGPGCEAALADRGQVEAALLNLAINARDAMPGGGRLEIGSGRVSVSAKNPVGALAPGEYAVMWVSDTGTGMPREVAERVFDPFFTTKEIGKGSGLGLSMVFGFARQSGGDLILETRSGTGTSFHLYLPISGDAPSTPSPDVEAPPSGCGEHLLVVEDDADVRELAAAMLRALGYRVSTAAGASQGRRILADCADIALLLSDVVLAHGTSGPGFASEARAKLAGLPVVYMSGYSTGSVAAVPPMGPGDRLLTKPFLIGDLADAVRSALDSARHGV